MLAGAALVGMVEVVPRSSPRQQARGLLRSACAMHSGQHFMGYKAQGAADRWSGSLDFGQILQQEKPAAVAAAACPRRSACWRAFTPAVRPVLERHEVHRDGAGSALLRAAGRCHDADTSDHGHGGLTFLFRRWLAVATAVTNLPCRFVVFRFMGGSRHSTVLKRARCRPDDTLPRLDQLQCG